VSVGHLLIHWSRALSIVADSQFYLWCWWHVEHHHISLSKWSMHLAFHSNPLYYIVPRVKSCFDIVSKAFAKGFCHDKRMINRIWILFLWTDQLTCHEPSQVTCNNITFLHCHSVQTVAHSSGRRGVSPTPGRHDYTRLLPPAWIPVWLLRQHCRPAQGGRGARCRPGSVRR
jgi:hypothetical protein